MTAEGWKKYIGSISIIMGTVIGVGVFGLPYLAAQAGFWVIVAYLVWGTTAAILASLVFGELMFRTRERHRVPGYVAKYLGPRWGKVVYASATVGLLGGQFVYLLVGGHFLHVLLGPMFGGQEWMYVLGYALVGGALIFDSGSALARSELVMLPIMLLVMGLVIGNAGMVGDWTRLMDIHLPKILIPYGVVMFSIWGISSVGEVRDYLGSRHAAILKPAVITSYILSAVTYVAFTASILAATGSATSPDALGGLQMRLGSQLTSAFYLFGVFTTFTSYISIGQTIKKIFVYDSGWSNGNAWFITAIVPPVLYALGVTDFLLVMSLIGSITLGIDTIALLAAYLRARKHHGAQLLPYHLRITRPVVMVVCTLFILGIISAVIEHLTPAA